MVVVEDKIDTKDEPIVSSVPAGQREIYSSAIEGKKRESRGKNPRQNSVSQKNRATPSR